MIHWTASDLNEHLQQLASAYVKKRPLDGVRELIAYLTNDLFAGRHHRPLWDAQKRPSNSLHWMATSVRGINQY